MYTPIVFLLVTMLDLSSNNSHAWARVLIGVDLILFALSVVRLQTYISLQLDGYRRMV